MSRRYIDINCDVGEGIGNEALLFPHISSCNIACGGHAGDITTMTNIVRLAKDYEIKIGAHPSYPDKTNFGRKVMQISNETLKQSIKEQLLDFDAVLEKEDCDLHHIKAHGALYNEMAKNKELAETYLDAIQAYRDTALLYVPYNSIIAEMAVERGFTIWFEAFADRNYTDELKLVSRSHPDALIKEPKAVLTHMLSLILEDKVVTLSGKKKRLESQTYCVHGDTPSALEILTYLSKELPRHEVMLNK